MSSVTESSDILVDRPIPRERLRSTERGVLVTCTASHCQWQGLFPDAVLAKEAAESHYDHEIRNGAYHRGKRSYTIVRLLDDATAQTVDESSLGFEVKESRLRGRDGTTREVEFPRSTDDVSELVQRGDRIRLPGEREQKVYRVSETRSHGLRTWTVVYVDLDVDLTDARTKDFYWLNELVARDGNAYTSYGPDPLAAPTFEVVGETDHQASFSKFVARADGGNGREVGTDTDRGEMRTVDGLLVLAAGLLVLGLLWVAEVMV